MAHTRVLLFSLKTVDGGNNAATKIDARYCYYFGHYSVRVPYVLVDVLLNLHVSLTTKITVTLFTIISTYSYPGGKKIGRHDPPRYSYSKSING